MFNYLLAGFKVTARQLQARKGWKSKTAGSSWGGTGGICRYTIKEAPFIAF
jgi:hypothetical protein